LIAVFDTEQKMFGAYRAGGIGISAVKTRPSARKIAGFIPIWAMTVAMMLVLAAVPVAIFYKHVKDTSFARELSYVNQNHLIIAQNLSRAMSRFASDAQVTFNLAINQSSSVDRSMAFADALAAYGICEIQIYDNSGNVVGRIEGKPEHHPVDRLAPELFADLRTLARDGNGESVVSGIRILDGVPHFFIARKLDNGLVAIAPWSTAYVNELQKSIAFGERGHSMVVDQFGHVVAHPNPQWQATAKDASRLSVVQEMMAGRTGVMQFYSPPMAADMIAGFTSVPETGWGVMVPQPISELEDHARQVQRATLAFAGVVLLLASSIGLAFSRALAAPIEAVASSAAGLARGDFSTRVSGLPWFAPRETRQLAQAFDSMAEELQTKTDNLRLALDNAEAISEERARLLAAAEEANRVKSQFVSMVSHELRTPLTSIKGALELMESGAVGDLSEQSTGLVNIAIKNSRRLALMIDDLLDLEKMKTGNVSFNFERLDLNAMLAEVTEANATYAALRDVSFEVVVPDQVVMTDGDGDRLTQVMANLLSNSVKFSPAGAKVRVALGVQDGAARISVSDTGPGVPADKRAEVFERFVQVDTSDTRNVGGSGLRLSIAKMIVDRHDGRIWCEDGDDGGARFVVALPLAGDA